LRGPLNFEFPYLRKKDNMASDAFTLDRLRNLLRERHVTWTEKRMFGGDCFMVDDKMCFGTYKGGIMFRVNPELDIAALNRPGTATMMQGGHQMPGFLQAEPEAYDREEDLVFWVEKCLAYNPLAKASKKKK
jgi:TfoX/Sxy family transcriptional regulator of competence genes